MGLQNPPANYDQLWGLYGNKPGAGALGGAGLMGAGAALGANRFAPGLPTKPMPADLHRSFPPQASLLAFTPCHGHSRPLLPPGCNIWSLCDRERDASVKPSVLDCNGSFGKLLQPRCDVAACWCRATCQTVACRLG